MATQKILTIRDNIATTWLMNILGYLSVSRYNGIPENVENARNEMTNSVVEWTMDMMRDLPIENLARHIKFTNESGRDFVEITWDVFGRISYNFPYLLVMNQYAQNIQLIGKPFDYTIETPKNIHERFNIVKDEKLAVKIIPMLDDFALEAKCSVYGAINERKIGSSSVPEPYAYGSWRRKDEAVRSKFMASAYIADVLLGKQKNNLTNIIALKKKLNSFKEKINSIDQCFDRLEEFKTDLFNTLYDPENIKAYVDWCVKTTKDNISRVLEFINNYSDKIDENGKVSREVSASLSYHEEWVIEEMCKRNILTVKDAIKDMQDNNMSFLGYLVVNPCHNPSGLEDMPKKLKSVPILYGSSAILKQMSSKYPELVNGKTGLTPIGVCSEEYDKLVNAYSKLIVQFMTRTDGSSDTFYTRNNSYGTILNYELEKNFIGTLGIILPDENICKIVHELCTDMDDDAKNALPGFFAYKDDFFGTFAKQPAVMTINTEDVIVCNNRYNNRENIINNYGLDTCIRETIKYLIMKQLRTNTFDEKAYEKEMRNCVDLITGNPSDGNKCNIYSMTIPGTDDYESNVNRMTNDTNKMIHACELIQDALLKSDNPDFIEWCISHKFVDKKTATARIAELDAQPADTD